MLHGEISPPTPVVHKCILKPINGSPQQKEVKNKKSVGFSVFVKTILIPSRSDYFAAGLIKKLFYTANQYKMIQEACHSEVRRYAAFEGICMREAKKKLYASTGESNDLFNNAFYSSPYVEDDELFSEQPSTTTKSNAHAIARCSLDSTLHAPLDFPSSPTSDTEMMRTHLSSFTTSPSPSSAFFSSSSSSSSSSHLPTPPPPPLPPISSFLSSLLLSSPPHPSSPPPSSASLSSLALLDRDDTDTDACVLCVLSKEVHYLASPSAGSDVGGGDAGGGGIYTSPDAFSATFKKSPKSRVEAPRLSKSSEVLGVVSIFILGAIVALGPQIDGLNFSAP